LIANAIYYYEKFKGVAMNIWYSSKEMEHLSNLAYRPFKDKIGREFVSVEHAYQTFKSGKFDEETYKLEWTGGRKFFGKKQADKSKNIEIMYKLMKASFEQNPLAIKSLLWTGDNVLTHKQDKGIWNKKFPELLMQLREEFRLSI
jgi:predicted NAD-dependent protein-ADP-ribosyltransferase YbiA (DUF1768 family)